MKSENFKILLVEDEPDHAHLIMRELKKSWASNTVDWVDDGKKALDYLQGKEEHAGNDISLLGMILLDIKLPKLNGLEVLEWVKNNEDTRDIPVIMLTTSADIKDIEKSYGLGANLYVEKSVENFVKRIKNIGMYCQYLRDSENED
ncbi:MAG: response regulator [Candidatus Methanofastidiosia archaeon]